MKRAILTLAVLALGAGAAQGDAVRHRWAGAGRGAPKATHPGTLEIKQDKTGPRLVFDLSAIPKSAKVHHASLYCFTTGGRQPTEPPKVYAPEKEQEGAPTGSPLKLEAPWYHSFDATEAVARWVPRPESNLGFAVAQFEGLIPAQSYLEVLYEGRPEVVPEQAAGVRAVHHDGQTFIAFTEHPDFRPTREEVIWVEKFVEGADKLAEGPGQGAYGMPNHPGITLTALRRLQGYALRTEPSPGQEIRDLKRIREVLPVTYRVYRHSERITAGNIHQAEYLAEVEPLSGLDGDVYRIHYQGEYLNQREEPTSVIPAYCLDKGKALTPGEGLYVHTSRQAGKFFYAVTTAVAGTENLSQVGDSNSLSAAVEEKPATPQPVLQWVQEDHYHKDVPEYWYRYWAAPPYFNLPSQSFRLAVAVPEKLKQPCPLIIGSISGTFNVRESLNLPSRTAVTIEPECHFAWMPNLFFNEGRGTLRGMSECKVDYFTERYMEFMIKWIMGQYEIDRSKISGSLLHFGLRHPEIFTVMSMGSYTAGYDLRWAPGGPAMPGLLGPRGIKTARGEDAWAMYSVGEYVNTYPERDIPFLICISGTGKDGGHTSEFGWQDDPRGWAGLLKARQPFVAAWSDGIPREVGEGLNKMRWDITIPAFSYCSLDDNPGNGDPTDGDYYGQINGWLLWSDADPKDEKDRWEMTVFLVPSAPASECTVDVTPRRCKEFKPKAGQEFKWSNTALDTGKVLQSGTIAADKHGLVTLKALKVTKGKNRIRIER